MGLLIRTISLPQEPQRVIPGQCHLQERFLLPFLMLPEVSNLKWLEEAVVQSAAATGPEEGHYETMAPVLMGKHCGMYVCMCVYEYMCVYV